MKRPVTETYKSAAKWSHAGLASPLRWDQEAQRHENVLDHEASRRGYREAAAVSPAVSRTSFNDIYDFYRIYHPTNVGAVTPYDAEMAASIYFDPKDMEARSPYYLNKLTEKHRRRFNLAWGGEARCITSTARKKLTRSPGSSATTPPPPPASSPSSGASPSLGATGCSPSRP